MAKKKNKCPLVIIEWEDSAQPLPAWQRLSDLSFPGVVKCVSVGWLVKDGRKVKVLAPNMGDVTSASNIQGSGFMQIPASCVTSIKDLVEK